MQIESPHVDWERIKRCLASIDRASHSFLQRAFLIGGTACWFYRIQLAKANDPDFRVPVLSPANERVWLSKDIDFAGISGEEILSMLPASVHETESRRYAMVDGVRIGYAQAGLTINPEEAIRTARLGLVNVDGRAVKFLVADPLTLFIEKSKLVESRSQQNDWFHRALLYDYICYELVQGAEIWLRDEATADVAETRKTYDAWLQVRNRAPEVLSDPRLNARLTPVLKPGHPISTCLQR